MHCWHNTTQTLTILRTAHERYLQAHAADTTSAHSSVILLLSRLRARHSVDALRALTDSTAMLLRLLAPLTLAALTLFSTAAMGASEPPVRMPVKLVDVRGAAALLSRGATVLDARDAASFAQGHIPSAQLYAWQAFTGEGASRGRLKPDPEAIAQALGALGVDAGRPALVYGDTVNGWGEEGHAAWLLALLGHPDIALLDGGFATWRAAGRPVVTSFARPQPGRFTAHLRTGFRAMRDDVKQSRQVIDVRTAVEFHGATPYGEARGGHIPGARNLDWRSLFDDRGRATSAARLQRDLETLHIDPREDIVVYCTCGVRSAMAAAVMASRGALRVRNYDASLAEWAADPTLSLAL